VTKPSFRLAGRHLGQAAAAGTAYLFVTMRIGLLLAAASLSFAELAAAGIAQRPLQQGSSQGVHVSVYAPARAVFDLSRASRHVRRLLSGTGTNPGCLKARVINGHWRHSETSGPVTPFAPQLQVRLRVYLFHPPKPPRSRPYRAPYDGCEISGFYGHRWNDAFGTRNAVEIWLTASGRHFFNDRASARDLAYFVRSRRVQQTIRLSDTPGAGLAWYVHRYPGRVVRLKSPSTTVPKDVIGVWIGARKIVFTATSSTGRRFFVVAKRSTYKLPLQNLDKLALVF
jgi:hypothetical protein